MSKKIFLQALALARDGRLLEAVELAKTIQAAFVRKRLTHYKIQPDHREAALRLEAALAAAAPPRPGLIQAILRKTRERTPRRASDRWLTFAPAPEPAERIPVLPVRENTPLAAELQRGRLRPALLESRAIELDFAGLDLCTQNFLHALLFEPVRLAWALRVPIHIVNADPAVREGLRFLEAYALGG